ncbi:glycoside hydrolase family 88 protein [Vallitalea maricola]|uniref:Glycoside hydrolase family 88 protein n=1 Tax=Vallitalea maricola TaxID=3074433 RepID=A0ACB5UH99_9FIRM|nr:glycoside hydrolase family 88 protein [Vallitalea sp. AN17-2]
MDKVFDQSLLAGAIDEALIKINKNVKQCGNRFPESSSHNNQYELHDNRNDWTQSFWSGLIWLAYEWTSDERYKALGQKHTLSFKKRLENNWGMDTHDIGFLYSLSCVADYKVTGSVIGKETALKAADRLLERYKEKGGFIQAWGPIDDPKMYRLIIDCYMNLPLLFWAYETTGDEKYLVVAKNHAYTAKQVLMREDSSTYHTYYFDPLTGEPLRGVTAQGYGDDSCWARGQAWAIYGFALCYHYLKDDVFIEAYKQVTDYYKDHLPEDKVPYWDLCFTKGEEERDTSAATIAICGILEMDKYIHGDSRQKTYKELAKTSMASLIRHYTTFNTSANGLLFEGVYSKPDHVGVNEMVIWGDYFFIEGLMRMTKDWQMYW